eukprot:CAMPEP_0170554272 /NCGR_PEP_ID=MMETSP0211-20121228/12140_1 /TAXON_ID=311385 /ORGANISM="Pseudokeronopsis sp., Strain OXSARD2" /LENGTH=88 /DNA_ID=CAMNT_0010863219 /DNA_START=807 /DNA_END=1073 /DNA_ORIENTATION=+
MMLKKPSLKRGVLLKMSDDHLKNPIIEVENNEEDSFQSDSSLESPEESSRKSESNCLSSYRNKSHDQFASSYQHKTLGKIIWNARKRG